MLNEGFENNQRLLKYDKSGEFSTNLVTLNTHNKYHLSSVLIIKQAFKPLSLSLTGMKTI